MSFGDTLDYITLGNPISQMLIIGTKKLIEYSGLQPKEQLPQVSAATLATAKCIKSISDLAGGHYNFVRLAGLSGAGAIILGAYCKYNLKSIEDHKDQMESLAVADVANRIHFLHSIVLITMPSTHYPLLTGSLMTLGTMFFCGPMYYRALTGDKKFQHFATGGGFCLIGAWFSLLL